MIFRVLVMGMLLGIALAHAQEPIRLPQSTPAPGSPGTATPQPYVRPTVPAPIRRHDSLPLQPPLGQSLRHETDQPIPLLDEQLRRNSQGLGDQRKQE